MNDKVNEVSIMEEMTPEQITDLVLDLERSINEELLKAYKENDN